MSATGTPTPNIGLRIPLGTDPASVDDINYNSNLIDTKLGAVGNDSVQDQIDTLSTNTAQSLGKVQDGLAIVANGNTHVAIPADYFVYVKGHNSLSEGLYKNTSGSTIAANATLSTSNLTADDDGGLNSVYSTLNENLTSYSSQSIATGVALAKYGGHIGHVHVYTTSNSFSSANLGVTPKSNVISLCKYFNGSSNTTGYLYVSTDGTVKLYNYQDQVVTGSYVMGDVWFIY